MNKNNKGEKMKIKVEYTMDLPPDQIEYLKHLYGSDWRRDIKMNGEVNGRLSVEEDNCGEGWDSVERFMERKNEQGENNGT